jgi:putative ABC transport system permease protein
MLELIDIKKDYVTGGATVPALKGISLKFRDSEFVSILGQSGCGKTTMLNIVGGLDQYTSGDLRINGVSTKDYKDRDWDFYRNNSIGFVFQSYNLIPHQTVLANVELALTLSGVSKSERRKRALDALEQVGLSEHVNKKPNQMSGGQMQRVAIARALVNNPDILLADEPTGALDTETSVQIMEILKEISHDRLIIMVTHNPELAFKYSTRIIKLLDGKITDDSDPFNGDAEDAKRSRKSSSGEKEDAKQGGEVGSKVSRKEVRAEINAAEIETIDLFEMSDLERENYEYQKSWEQKRTRGAGSSKRKAADAEKKREIEKNNSETGANKEKKSKKAAKKQRTSMSFFTALSLSRNNLMTKKGRTLLTAFAGSIGIIGIALILAISNGIQVYIDRVQRDTLSSYPVTIQSESIDVSSMIESLTGQSDKEITHDKDKVYSNNIMTDMVNSMVAESSSNNLNKFRTYIEDRRDELEPYVSDIMYSYDVPLYIYSTDTSEGAVQLNPGTMLDSMGMGTNESSNSVMTSSMTNSSVWNQLLDNQELLNEQYDVVAGSWPSAYNEVVLVIDENNEIADYTLYSLGFKDPDEVKTIFKNVYAGQSYEVDDMELTYDEILSKEFKLVYPTQFYSFNTRTGAWDDCSKDDDYMKKVVNNAETIKISGIIRPNPDAVNTAISNGVGYTRELMLHIIDKVNESEIVQLQQADKEVDVFTGVPFNNTKDTPITMDDVNAYLETLQVEDKMQMQAFMSNMTEEQILDMFSQSVKVQTTDATYESNKKKLGITSEDTPSQIDIYCRDFESKEHIADFVKQYNKEVDEDGRSEDEISYTDYVGIIMSSVSTIITAISSVLIAFVAISLVVSSIMVGIITYISVLERTKEIGILRSIGASKKDVKRVFNAETFIEGLVSGVMGIAITLLLCIPANIIIQHFTNIANLAKLPVAGAVILIIISVVLTTIAGLVPASMAAKKDPVVALRTE